MKENESKNNEYYVSFRAKSDDGMCKYYMIKCIDEEQAKEVRSSLNAYEVNYVRIGKATNRQDKLKRKIIDAGDWFGKIRNRGLNGQNG